MHTPTRSSICRLAPVLFLLGALMSAGDATAQLRTALQPADLNANDQFGTAVVLDGDRLFVGAKFGTGRTVNSGVVYVYEYDGSEWVETDRLMAGDSEDDDQFGGSIAVDGDLVVVGARRHAGGPGAAYVFRYNGTTWVEEAKLIGERQDRIQWFGIDVAVEGDLIAVGEQEDNTLGEADGSASVFRYVDGAWVRETKLFPSDDRGDFAALFGASVRLNDERLFVGASNWCCGAGAMGAVYEFNYDGSEWREAALIRPEIEPDQDRFFFGVGLDVEGDLLIAGEPRSDRLFVFRHDGQHWVEEDRLSVPDGTPGDELGLAAKIHGHAIVAGAPFTPDWTGHGKAYLFTNDGDGWNLTVEMADDLDGQDEFFGEAIDVNDRWMVLGVPQDGALRLGKVWIYDWNALVLTDRERPEVASDFHLDPNYPNPFNPSTEITFTLPTTGTARLAVYDVLGREVARPADGLLTAGEHRVRFDAAGLPSGLYLYRLESGAFVQSRRMVLAK